LKSKKNRRSDHRQKGVNGEGRVGASVDGEGGRRKDRTVALERKCGVGRRIVLIPEGCLGGGSPGRIWGKGAKNNKVRSLVLGVSWRKKG